MILEIAPLRIASMTDEDLDRWLWLRLRCWRLGKTRLLEVVL
jgi:hypothetical protein